MCVAVMISGPSPALEDLKLMEDENPHGGGMAYPTPKGVAFVKNLDYKEIHKLVSKVPRPCLVHFRWATHGGIKPHLIHPFPLGPRAFSTSMRGVAKAVLIHNGVWTGYNRWVPKGINPNETSDTAVAAFAAQYDESVLEQVAWSTAVGRSRAGTMEVTLRGDWKPYKGVLYSNLRWKSPGNFTHSYYGNYGEEWETYGTAYGTRKTTSSSSSTSLAKKVETSDERLTIRGKSIKLDQLSDEAREFWTEYINERYGENDDD